MNIRMFSHLGNQALLSRFDEEIARQCVNTATLIALIAEVDLRRLYLPAGYPSMCAYCVHKMNLPREAALKRIHAARAAREYEAILDALAEGRLHLTAVQLLAPRLTPENADELLAAATHKTKDEIQQLLAARFPRPDLPTRLEALTPPLTLGTESAEGNVQEPSKSRALEHVESAGPRPKLTPLSAQTFALQMTIRASAQEKLGYIQALLGHALPAGEIPELFERALDAYIRELEKQKFCATSRPRRPGARRSSSNPRHIPASVKCAVWQRDGGQCGFVGENGNRCTARTRLEFDHADPVARGGEATVEGIRLRCRAHNQYEAELVFGAGFMSEKRAEARARAEARKQAKARETERKAQTQAAPEEVRAPLMEARAQSVANEAPPRAVSVGRPSSAPVPTPSTEPWDDRDMTPYLRKLGYNACEARLGAEACASIPNASLDERVRVALRMLMPPCRHIPAPTVTATAT
jgi:5-methylcytosine-specific restriction endonuclease McrA